MVQEYMLYACVIYKYIYMYIVLPAQTSADLHKCTHEHTNVRRRRRKKATEIKPL